jgi:hypothetical protein
MLSGLRILQNRDIIRLSQPSSIFLLGKDDACEANRGVSVARRLSGYQHYRQENTDFAIPKKVDNFSFQRKENPFI